MTPLTGTRSRAGVSLPGALLAMLAAVAPVPIAAQTFIGPSSYLSSASSPFAGIASTYFYLENFEDGSLNVPGVSLLGGLASVLPPGGFTDSVDDDDGATDGSGTAGRSLYSSNVLTEFVFDFDGAALGGLPTYAGIVWTDVGNVLTGTSGFGGVRFEAFGPGLTPLGSMGPLTLGDGSVAGGTGEDRLFGVRYTGGISRIRLSMDNSTDWEADHLQFGREVMDTPNVVPEPATSALTLVGLGALLAVARRRRARGAVTP